ncbi:hypothetical protein B0T18DRAFT_240747 [Schizothecium vesticola]|uniref:SRR1-like domain-containing protein n=1 Tax=Schizothecium vesticola TaxID=314040 RepID=A0AA40BPS7_9PEZI|nr:hypothetical protein B0T18DRAFT_240747 [Schizothecium vesticola]
MGSHFQEPLPAADTDAVLAESFKLFTDLPKARKLEKKPADSSAHSKSVKFVLPSSPIELKSQEADEDSGGAGPSGSRTCEQASLQNRYWKGLPVFTRGEIAELGDLIDRGRIQYSSKPRINYESHHNFEVRTQHDDKLVYDPLPLKAVLKPDESRFKVAARTAKLAVAFQQELARWRASAPSEELHEILTRAEIPPIKKIVAFGLGTMMQHHIDEPLSRPLAQHAMLLQVAEFFHETQPCILLQDPDYREHDKAVVESLWVNAGFVDDPQGFLEIDDDTLVISIRPDVPVRTIVADIATPAAMIWAGRPLWAYMDPKKKELDPDPASPRLDYLMQNVYAAFPYPACPLTNTGWKSSVLNQIICVRDIDHLKDVDMKDKINTDMGLKHLVLKARSTAETTSAVGNGTTSAAVNGTTSAAVNGTTSAAVNGTKPLSEER